jgi:hypothetical protein
MCMDLLWGVSLKDCFKCRVKGAGIPKLRDLGKGGS